MLISSDSDQTQETSEKLEGYILGYIQLGFGEDAAAQWRVSRITFCTNDEFEKYMFWQQLSA